MGFKQNIINKFSPGQKAHKIFFMSSWIILLIGLIIVLGFVDDEQRKQPVTQVLIDIQPEVENYFVNKELVEKLLTGDKKLESLINKPGSLLDISGFEKELESNPFVKNAEVYVGIGGDLKIEIEQRQPILRILKGDGSGYYLDEDGIKVPISPVYTSRVPIATGNIYESIQRTDTISSYVLKELFILSTYIKEDEFWKAQCEQFFVDAKSDIWIIPKIGNHSILIGNTENLEDKMQRLMIFYQKGLNKIGWDKYKVINLKYSGQIVCEKW